MVMILLDDWQDDHQPQNLPDEEIQHADGDLHSLGRGVDGYFVLPNLVNARGIWMDTILRSLV